MAHDFGFRVFVAMYNKESLALPGNGSGELETRCRDRDSAPSSKTRTWRSLSGT